MNSIPKLSADRLSKLLPLVRSSKLPSGVIFFKRRLVIVDSDKITSGILRPRDTRKLFFQNDWSSLGDHLKRSKKIALSDVESCTLYPGSILNSQARLVVTSKKTKIKTAILMEESENLAAVLSTTLDEKFTLAKRAKPRVAFSFLLALMIAAYLFLIKVVLLDGNFSKTDFFAGSILFGVLLLVLISLLALEIKARKFLWQVAEKKTKPTKQRDLSGVKPFRSRFIGWMLKIISAVAAIVSWYFGFGPLAVLPLATLYLGHLLTQVPPETVRASDKRAPIVYLRSFLDDRAKSLVPSARWALLSGVQPPRYLPSPWNYILQLNPIRILRVFFGLGVDTSEEQLALHFRDYGPFVAIGKPGETFASPGASRMYVTNDDWQKVVLDLLGESQAVVLQPAKTEGVWWEVEKSLSNFDKKKVLFCMVNFQNRQNDYENFRIRVEEFSGLNLPKVIAYSRTPVFIHFDNEGVAYVQEVSCRSPILWPYMGDAVDLGTTLKPFSYTAGLGAMDGVSKTVSNIEPCGVSRGSHAGAMICYLLVVGLIAVIPSLAEIGRQSNVAFEQSPECTSSKLLTPVTSGNDQTVETVADSVTSKSEATTKLSRSQQALELLNGGQVVEASEIVDELLQSNPDDLDALLVKSLVLESKGENEESVQVLKRMLEWDPNHYIANNNLGGISFGRGKLDDAIKYYSKAIERQPTALSVTNRAAVYLEKGELDNAMADYERSRKLDPKHASTYYVGGKILAQQKKWVDAIKNFNSAIQLSPNMVDAHVQRAFVFVQAGQKTNDFNPYTEALTSFNNALRLSPGNRAILAQIAGTKYLDDQYEASIEYAMRVTGEPDSPNWKDSISVPARRDRHYAYVATGKSKEAIVEIDMLINDFPDVLGWKTVKVNSLVKLGKKDEATALMKLLVEQNPKSIDLRNQLGNLCYGIKNYREAIKVFNFVLETHPNNLVALRNRALINAYLGNFDASADDYKAISRLQPDDVNPLVRRFFALYMAEEWRELETHTAALQKFYDNQPIENYPNIVEFLLLNKNRSNDFKNHIAKLQEALEIAPTPFNKYVMAFAKSRSRQYEEAKAEFKAVRDNFEEMSVVKALATLRLAETEYLSGDMLTARKTLSTIESYIVKNSPATISDGESLPQLIPEWIIRARLVQGLKEIKSLMVGNK